MSALPSTPGVKLANPDRLLLIQIGREGVHVGVERIRSFVGNDPCWQLDIGRKSQT